MPNEHRTDAPGENGGVLRGRRVSGTERPSPPTTPEQRRFHVPASVRFPPPSDRRVLTHTTLSYSLRFSVPIPSEDALPGLARFLTAVYEVAVAHHGRGMHVGPVEERRLERRPDEPFPCVPVTLDFDDSVNPRPVTQALDELIDRAESISFPDAHPTDGP